MSAVRPQLSGSPAARARSAASRKRRASTSTLAAHRSEEHTSELQSQSNLVCRLLLEKKKTKTHPGGLDQDAAGHLSNPNLRIMNIAYHTCISSALPRPASRTRPALTLITSFERVTTM